MGGRRSGIAATAFILAAVIGCPDPAKPPTPAPSAPEPPSTQEQVFERLRSAKGAEHARRWTDAERAYAQVLDLDPIHADAREGRARARREIQTQQVFEDARRKESLGENAAALQLYLEIPEGSAYRSEAKARVGQLVSLLLRRYRANCLGDLRARRYPEAVENCRAHASIACQCPDVYADREVDEARAKAEKASRGSAAAAWECTDRLKGWIACEVDERRATSRFIERTYSDPAVREAVRAYDRGELDEALGGLEKIRRDRRHPGYDQAAQLTSNIRVVEGKWKEGLAHLGAGRTEDADTAWELALAADAKVIAPPAVSWLRRQVEQQLGDAYAARAGDLLRQRRFVDALQACERGFRAAPSHTGLKRVVQQLESEAASLLRQSPGCDDLAVVIGMTRSEPPSPAHRQAIARSAESGCR